MTTESPYATPPRSTIAWRTLASAIAVFLGGYLLVSALTGQLAFALSGVANNPPELTLYLVLQLLFALAVVVGGLVLTPASTALRLIAAVIVLGVALVTVATQVARLTGSLGSMGVPASLTAGNGYVMVLLGVGAAWLLVRGARLGWLALIAAFILAPVPYAMTFAGIPSLISTIISLALSAAVGAGIIVAGRPLRD